MKRTLIQMVIVAVSQFLVGGCASRAASGTAQAKLKTEGVGLEQSFHWAITKGKDVVATF